ncbi:MAG TPA: hypothetical protein VJN50_04420 [Actinomycetota bacterium]|nr:hypothetical protein [Actinomycetota bacterium]
MGFDERIREELERLAEPADPPGLEDVGRRKWRRLAARRAQRAFLSVAVVVGTLVGAWGLYATFTAGVRDVTPGSPLGSYANGDKILFSLYMEEHEKQWSLYTIRPDGSDAMPLTPDDSEELYPDHSPDGSRIAFVRWQQRETGIWVMDADGSNQRLVWAPSDSDIFNIEQVRWSPDGERIGFVLEEAILKDPPPEAGVPYSRLDQSIWVMNADGSYARQIVDGGEGAAFDWSPDGAEIVFSRTVRLSDEGEKARFSSDLYVAKADGTDEVQLTSDGQSWNPAWSPDGSRIAFDTSAPGSDWEQQVEVMNVDGTHRHVVAPGSDRYSPSWSPDGTKILAVSQIDDPDSFSKCHLYLIDVERDSARSIFQSRTSSDCPNGVSWQPVPIEPEPVAIETTEPPVEPTQEPSPEPQETQPVEASPEVGLLEIGCFRSVVAGDFDGDGVLDAAYGGFLPGGTWDTTQPPDEQCRGAEPDPENFDLTVELAGYNVAFIQEPGACEDERCRVFAAPDIDADGASELAVAVRSSGTRVALQLYRFDGGGLERFEIPDNESCEGDTCVGVAAGPATFEWGASADGTIYGVDCVLSDDVAMLRAWTGNPRDDGTFFESGILYEISGRELVPQFDVDWDAEPHDAPPADLCGAPVNG